MNDQLKAKRMRQHISLAILAAFVLLLSGCTLRPVAESTAGVSDAELIATASGLPEAQAFLENYPQAQVSVERSSELAVDYRQDQKPVTSTTDQWEGIRLRVFIDPRTGQPVEAFLQCKDSTQQNHFIRKGLIEYLEQYAAGQRCP